MNNQKITATNRALIQSVVRENPKYQGHEDLMDAFVEAIYKKSYLLLDTIKDMERLTRHLSAICNSCMETVIKEQIKQEVQNIQDEKKEENKDQKLYIEVAQTPAVQNLHSLRTEEKIKKADEDDYEFSLLDYAQSGQDLMQSLFDPLDICTKEKTSEDTIDKLVKIVRVLDAQYPQKQYYTMFCLRYMKKCNQLEIAHKMKLSQKDLSKRFVELIKLTKNYA